MCGVGRYPVPTFFLGSETQIRKALIPTGLLDPDPRKIYRKFDTLIAT